MFLLFQREMLNNLTYEKSSVLLPLSCDNNNLPPSSKMFVGGLSWQTSEDSMKEYFAQFGPVLEALVMRDPATKHSRGFGFVTFAQPESVEKVSQAGVHSLDGKKIDPKVAFPKESTPKVSCCSLSKYFQADVELILSLCLDGDQNKEDIRGGTLHHHHPGGSQGLLL